MNDFDQRWQTVAASARPAFHDPDVETPFGLGTAVLARWRQSPSESWEEVLGFVGKRALLTMTVFCMISAGFAYAEWFPSTLERPMVERAINTEAWLP
jgi:hypothetical protein